MSNLTEKRLAKLMDLHSPISHEEVLSLIAEVRRLRALLREPERGPESPGVKGIAELYAPSAPPAAPREPAPAGAAICGLCFAVYSNRTQHECPSPSPGTRNPQNDKE